MSDMLSPVRGMGWRKTVAAILNNVGRTARVGNYWYWVDPPELRQGVAIAAIVCPLRYDVLIRRDFLAFYADHRDLYVADFDAFVVRVRQGTYYRWFMESEAVRTKRDLLDDPAALDAEFVARVRRAARLYESVAERGFDLKFPIILKTAEHLLPPTADKLGPPTGKRVSGRYFLADGCHRLALIMALGATELPPSYFRVKCFRRFSPFDSTSLLAPSLLIAPAAYFAFLSSYYCAPHVFEDGADFIQYVQKQKPQLLDEVRSVVRVDGYERYLARQSEIGGRR
jgi:hypothetical protein